MPRRVAIAGVGLTRATSHRADVTYPELVYEAVSGALEQAGLLRKLPSGRTFLYELTCDHSPPAHPHFTCRLCNRFICLEPVDLSAVWGLLTQNNGLVPETAEITLVGLCKECSAWQAKTGA